MKETAGKIQIDRAARAYLDSDNARAHDILKELIDRTIAEGRLSEDLHRKDLARMAGDCLLMAAKKMCADAGSELVIQFSQSRGNEPLKSGLDLLGIRHEYAPTGSEQ